MKQRIIKAGNSLAVVIPSRFVKSIGIHKGDEVKVRTNLTNGQVTYLFSGIHQLALPEDLLK